ncbi:universal stress protein [Nocardioides oleivorans]|uniref:Universal stress protein n=1 Tax=Nocardioides oleivorans TaxID=273676 RepID=A0A4Q2S174_9ACTN|nr:universal stress protein [Nocardioides oleivorans]RYB94135.1 universal stress protein [Nocardioides oleivorans]
MTLVVGFAPGKDDRSGLELGALLARSDGDDLRIVTAAPARWPTPVAGGTDREYADWARAHGEAAVAEATALMAQIDPDVRVKAAWVEGRSASSVLLSQAGKHGARAVVVGSGQAGAYGQVHLSSTADVLLHSASVPVAIAPRGFDAPAGSTVTRATCAFRGDEQSRRTLAATAEVCARTGAALRVATFAVRGRTMYPPETGLRDEDMVMEAWIEQTNALQAEALATIGEPRPDDVRAVVADGRTWQSAMDRLDWQRGDLLVVGSSRAGLASRLFLGPNATKILRASPVPVLVVP